MWSFFEKEKLNFALDFVVLTFLSVFWQVFSSSHSLTEKLIKTKTAFTKSSQDLENDIMAAGIARKCAINVSFSGCGFLGMYHIGVLARLREGQDSEKDSFAISSALGASAGALGNFLSYPIIRIDKWTE